MKQLILSLMCIGGAITVAAEDPLTAAREQYASAAYEEALATLTRLRAAGTAPDQVEQVDQYRAFCLFALGRTREAVGVSEGLITKNPTLQLDSSEVSPRIISMFAEVRKRLLPGLVRERYRTARTALDAKDFEGAETQLGDVRHMLEEAEKAGAMDETLSDMRVLVDGFLDLTRTLRANAASNNVAQRPVPQPPSPADADAAARSQPAAPRIFDSSAASVTAPVALRQIVPSYPSALLTIAKAQETKGVLEVVIDENGNVERSIMRDSVNPIYDGLVVQASKSWKYRPAMFGEKPVKYLKTIVINVQR
jgi:hypothetical protein